MPILTAQRDFSSGELNVDAKRRDDQPVMRSGARSLRNWRVLNSGAAVNRPGRRPFMLGYDRVDEVLMSVGVKFWLCFSQGTLTIRSEDGATVAALSINYPWTSGNVGDIRWTLVPTGAQIRNIVICFQGNPLKTVTWYASGNTWFFSNFVFGAAADGSVQMPFYRLEKPGVVIQPSGYTGAITVTAFDNIWYAGIVGQIIRFYGRQIKITAFNSANNLSGSVVQNLYPSAAYSSTGVGYGFGAFSLGDIVADTSGNRGEVVGITGAITSLQINHINSYNYFATNAVVTGPNGVFKVSSSSPSAIQPGRSTIWDEAVFSDYRGWPKNCFFDQNRLGFCDIPGIPTGIGWSANNQFFNFDANNAINPTDSIFETVPEMAHVLHVAPKSDELVLTDRGVWHIPISETNPLKPGSVAFKKISVDAACSVRPAEINEGVVFINGGRNRVVAIVPTGMLTQPWQARETSLFHSHLFNNPVAIAATSGDNVIFSERYVYVVNGDGTIAIGKYDVGKEWVGWLPWDGAGQAKWVSSLDGVAAFVNRYGGLAMAELLDTATFIDGAIPINSVPVGLTPPAGYGPLYFIAGGTVDVMDGELSKGAYGVTNTGYIVPNDPGEDLSSLTLVAGFKWTNVLEPFMANADGGQDQHQRMRRRRIIRVAATYQQSSGFKISKLYSGQTGSQLPAAGTEMNFSRVASYSQGDNQALAPPRRDGTATWRPVGRSFDPRIAIIKDVPGPLTIVEIAMEITT